MPTRSPNFAPPDFFVCSDVSERVYLTKLNNLQEFSVTNVCYSVTSETLQNVRREFESRLYHYQEVNGG